jgi:3-oxoacyl-[acyl-carrier protein] reductase/meso-butanediol dehydrogenase/(S,S)-butanediol dehydrogenase/diacetyl reductase
MADLSGKVALVTGAGRQRGLGRAIALRLAQDGADVVVSAFPRDPTSYPDHEQKANWQGSESTAAEIREMGRKAIAADCDVTKKDSVQSMVDKAIGELGHIDILVNNAGLPSDAGAANILDMDDDVWYQTMDVNVNGIYLVTKAVGRTMRKAERGGSIVNISSLAGRRGLPDYGSYCASKFGVVGLTQQLALELVRYGIRTNCIAPGTHDTDMMDGTIGRSSENYGITEDQFRASLKSSVPMGRQGRPEELAAAVAFLAGDDASYVNGQTLNVDGGSQMN